MFDMFTKPIENAIDIAEDLFDGRMPEKRQVADLISAGFTVAAIAQMSGYSVEVIERLLEEG